MARIVTLSECRTGTVVTVKTVAAGRTAYQFLAELGVHPGVKVRVVKNDVGPLIIEIKGTRVAIGRRLGHKIIIEN